MDLTKEEIETMHEKGYLTTQGLDQLLAHRKKLDENEI